MKIAATLIFLLSSLSSAWAEEVIPCDKEAIAWHPAALPKELNKELADPTDAFVQAADLNGDGVDEIFISADFADDDATGGQNSHARIYGYDRKGFKILFDGYVNRSAKPVRILATSSSGYHDICTSQSSSASMQYVTVYQFTGTRYESVQCRDEEFTGEGHPPKITLYKCGSNK